jgi:phenylacetate-coenzyme A ligase PaaK-like adenylate-forming protein
MHALDRWLNRRMGRPAQGPPPGREELAAWQMARLRETVALARRESPFYREHLAGVDPAALRAPTDLARLPRLDARALRAAPERLLCTSQDEVARVVTLASSGSTGAPKRLFFTRADLDATVDFFRHGMELLAAPGDVVLALLPGAGEDGVGRLLTRGVEALGARCLCCPEPWNVPAALDVLEHSGARVLVGTPVHVHALARLAAARGVPPGQVRRVLMCWDALPEGLAARVQALLGCAVHEHWGMTETGLGGAVSCGRGPGMHLREADLLVEIAHPATGAPVADGRWGEIIISTLGRRAMPLIRYRSGDAGRILPGACPCASPLRRLDTVPGRLGAGSGPGRATLDAAVLALAGVLDYALSRGPRPGAWRLDLYLAPGAQSPARAVAAALAAPPWNASRADIRVAARDGRIAPGFAKRAMPPAPGTTDDKADNGPTNGETS